MPDFSEFVVHLTIWVLAGAGVFFGLRSALRKRRRRKKDE